MDQRSDGMAFDVAIAGETNLDLILYGLPDPMPLERELLASGFMMTLGGSSSILAHNLAVLGTRVAFTTLVGDDDMGRLALERLSRAGLDVGRVVRRQDRATGVTVLLPHADGRHILTHAGVMAELSVADLDAAEIASSARHFHLSSLFLQTGLHEGLGGFLKELGWRGVTVSLDTNDDPTGEWGGVLEEVLDYVDILLPNESEVLRMTRTQDLESALDALRGRVATVVVKCGARGAVVQEGESRVWVRPPSVTPVDTIGAGDSFNAGFLHAWLQGRSAVSAARLGGITGALSTQGAGGTEAFLDPEVRERFLAMDAEPAADEGS